MIVSYFYIGLVILVAVVAIISAITITGRGTLLKCPECGETFKAPAMDKKFSGLGWTFPVAGVVECPNCGTSRPRRDYEKIKPHQDNNKVKLVQ